MKFRLSTLILAGCLLFQNVYAMDIVTNSENGTVTVTGEFEDKKSEPVSVSVFDKSGSRIPLYANQIVSENGNYSYELPLWAASGEYTLKAATSDEYQSSEFYFENDVYNDEEYDLIESDGMLRFRETFDDTLVPVWETTGNMHIENGWLSTDYGTGFKKAWLKPGILYSWENLTVAFRFMWREVYGQSNWMGAELCRQPDGTRHLLLWGENYISIIRADGTNTKIADCNFKKNTPYDIKIKAENDKITVYAKTAYENEFSQLGSADLELIKGGIGFDGWNTKVYYDNIEIYTYNDSIVYSEYPMRMEIGDTHKLHVSEKPENVIFSSNNTGVASVEADGSVTANAQGSATITVTADNVTETVPVYIKKKAAGISFSQVLHEMKEGEAKSIDLKLSSDSPTDTPILWKSSDESVVSVFGENNVSRTIIAKNEGQAVITAQTRDGKYEADCYVTVTAESDKGEAGAIFSVAEKAYEIPKTIYGVHHPLAGLVNTTNNYYHSEDSAMYSELGLGIIRGPEGGAANRYRWRTGDLSDRPLANGYTGFFIEDAYKIPNEINVPYCFAVNVSQQTVADITEQVKEIKKNTSKPIYLEMGNELYDMGSTDVFPSAADYVEKCREIYKAVKAIDENIKIGAVISVQWLAERLKSVPYVADWNEVVAANPDCYDAVIPHYYSSIDDMSGMTQEDMLAALNAYNSELYGEMLTHTQMFPNKEIWATEYGVLFADLYRQTDVREANRLQISKTPGVAISNMELVLNMIKSGNVTISAYHTGIGGSGFGLAQRNDTEDDLIKLPMYHTFKKLGELINGCGYYYDVNAVYTDKKSENADYIYSDCVQETEAAGAWAFGTDNGVEKVVLSNHSGQPMNVRLDGYEMSCEWSFGGENPFGDYLTKSEYWYSIPEFEQPKTGNGEYFDEILIEPHTIVVCNIRKANNNGLFACISTGNGNQAADVDEGVFVGLNNAPSDICTTMSSNGENVEITLINSGCGYYISPVDGYRYDTEYTITVNSEATNQNKELTFRTVGEKINKAYMMADADENGFMLYFDEEPFETSLENIKVFRNGYEIEYTIEKQNNVQYRIIPSGGYLPQSVYTLSAGTGICTADGISYAAGAEAEYITKPQIYEDFEGECGVEISGQYNISDGVLSFTDEEAEIIVSDTIEHGHIFSFDIKLGDKIGDSLGVNIGSEQLYIEKGGIRHAKNPLWKYEFKDNHAYNLVFCINESDIEMRISDENGILGYIPGRIALNSAEGKISVTADGTAQLDNVAYYPMSGLSAEMVFAAAGKVQLRLDFDGALMPEAVSDESVFVEADGQPVEADVKKLSDGGYAVTVNGVSDGGMLTLYTGGQIKDIYNVERPFEAKQIYISDMCDDELYVRNRTYYLDGQVADKLAKGKVSAEFEIANTSDDENDVWVISALYEKTDNGEILRAVNQHTEFIEPESVKTVKKQAEIHDNGSYILKTMFLNSSDIMMPYCESESIN